MRIISGKFGGRTFQPPAKMPYTRPTTDLAKGGLFNVIENNIDIEGIKTLDLFGGTGSISYELASRGATDQTIVEKDPQMAAFIDQISNKLGVPMKLVKMDVFKYIQQCGEQFDFIFAGPPYALGTIDELPKLIFEKQLLTPGGWFVLEHTPRNSYKSFQWFRAERNYGTTIFSIFVNKPKEE
ncbi:MAG: RsmD family RNA methyltransferase [Chitinophagaceae bacterium]|jgi:16S rRNA (guanine966-N2)-methyltransferase|nr:RsmD family RNA methyltransferase [Chitinophagaceae bacterium]